MYGEASTNASWAILGVQYTYFKKVKSGWWPTSANQEAGNRN